jgi:uncharacterized protein (TIGR01777 family)
VILRNGVVLSRDGGFLRTQLLPYRLGLGGPVCGGRQWMSWIGIDDAVAVMRRALDDGGLDGAYNATAPEPVRQKDLARTLARVLHRVAIVPTPLTPLRAVMGRELVSELLCASVRAVPTRLLAAGFTFAHPEIEGALHHALRR